MKHKFFSLVVLLATTGSSALPVYADAISPQIKNNGTSYSKEKPLMDFYGTGIGGRAMEASALRFEIERMLQDGEYEAAIPKAKKAVQLDPADPTTHVLLARALTRKFYATTGEVNEKLLNECLAEWRLIWFHDADQFEQVEAKIEAKKLMRINKLLVRRRMEEQKAQYEAKLALHKKRMQEAAANGGRVSSTALNAEDEDDDATASPSTPKKEPVATSDKKEPTASTDKKENVEVAEKKKRFGIF